MGALVVEIPEKDAPDMGCHGWRYAGHDVIPIANKMRAYERALSFY
jgi:hypothetical protein